MYSTSLLKPILYRQTGVSVVWTTVASRARRIAGTKCLTLADTVRGEMPPGDWAISVLRVGSASARADGDSARLCPLPSDRRQSAGTAIFGLVLPDYLVPERHSRPRTIRPPLGSATSVIRNAVRVGDMPTIDQVPDPCQVRDGCPPDDGRRWPAGDPKRGWPSIPGMSRLLRRGCRRCRLPSSRSPPTSPLRERGRAG
jgi:hypothetical protein